MTPFPPGSTIGILGGGQLGRMLVLAAAELGLNAHVFHTETQSPAADVAVQATCAPYNDKAALERFAQNVDVVTSEFENVPAEAAEFLAGIRPVRPGPFALSVAQDRLVEKEFAQRLSIGTPHFAAIDSPDALKTAIEKTGLPAVLKTRRMGYDGKGQAVVRSEKEAATAVKVLGGRGLILEERITFQREISVVLARGQDGAIQVYDIPENRHEGGILNRSKVPADIPLALGEDAIAAARRIADALDYVGVLAVEYFVTGDKATEAKLLFNEFAPRVHNSGHWTQDACLVSQFEQHIRAVAGWPLGEPRRHSDAVMDNLIGEAADRWHELAAHPGAALHLYGKKGNHPGRKMGHVTRISPRKD